MIIMMYWSWVFREGEKYFTISHSIYTTELPIKFSMFFDTHEEF